MIPEALVHTATANRCDDKNQEATKKIEKCRKKKGFPWGTDGKGESNCPIFALGDGKGQDGTDGFGMVK